MKKILIITFLFISGLSFAQPLIYRGKFYDVPLLGYGGDTAVVYGMINRNTGGSAGYYMVSGTDTVWMYVDKNGRFQVKSDHGTFFDNQIQIDANLSANDTALFININGAGNDVGIEIKDGGFANGTDYGIKIGLMDTAITARGWSNIDNINSSSVFSPYFIGGILTTSDLWFKTTTGAGATGADMHFGVGNNGGTEAMTILNSGKTLVNYNLGVRSLDPLSNIAVVGSNATNLNMFNFVNSDRNKIRTTIAQATDTSSIFSTFSSTGSPTLQVNGKNGNVTPLFKVDSSGTNVGLSLTLGASVLTGTVDIGSKLNSDSVIVAKYFTAPGIISNRTAVLTDNTPKNLFKVAFPADSATYGNTVSGKIEYAISIRGTDGVQSEKGTISYTGEEYLGVIVTNIAPDYERESLSAGSLAITATLTYATGFWTIAINADTDRGTPVIKCVFSVVSNNGGVITNL